MPRLSTGTQLMTRRTSGLYAPSSAAAAFSPLDLTPALWVDASDAATITLNVTRVSQWNDKSGNNRHLLQATSGNQPLFVAGGLNGLDVVHFDLTTRGMKTSAATGLAAPFGVCMAVRWITATANGYLFDSQATNADVLISGITTTSMRMYAGTALSAVGLSAPETMCISAKFNGASSELRKNGSTFASGAAGANAFELATVGNNSSLNSPCLAYIGEAIWWASPTAQNFTDVEAYIKAKWGTP